MGAPRRYIGTSHLFNIRADREFVNGLDIRISEHGVETAISTPIEPGRRRVVKVGPKEGRVIRELLVAMEQEVLRARRQAGEFAIPKPKGKRRTEPALVCDVCSGLGGNEDEDGNWVSCPDCTG